MSQQSSLLSLVSPKITPLFGAMILFFGLDDLRTSQAQEKVNVNKFASAEISKEEYDKLVTPFFNKNCFSCHGERRKEADLSLLELNPDMKKSTSAGRWAIVLDKLISGEMPPKSRPKPDEKSTQAVIHWIKAEMKRAHKHFARRSILINGNKVSHEKLFDPDFKAPFDNPARIRRLSPEIYEELLNDVARGVPGLGQPFTPDGRFLFKDMGAPKMDEPTTLQLLRNAFEIVKGRTKFKMEKGKINRIGFTPREFLTLFDPNKEATVEEIEKAISLQFRAVLSREPKKEE